VAELDSTTRRADVSALKHFVTRRIVDVRVPYGRYPISKPAAASFIGTINPDGVGFLSDPSGNRRFAVVEIDSIDWSYTAIDRDQLWAQVYAMYKAGEPFELTRHEQEVQAEMNLEYMTETVVEELVMKHYTLDPSDDNSMIEPMAMIEQLELLGLRGDQDRNKWQLGRIMQKRGIPYSRRRIDGKRVRVYVGVSWKGDKVTL
jgi:predicted P-loop ATPase